MRYILVVVGLVACRSSSPTVGFDALVADQAGQPIDAPLDGPSGPRTTRLTSSSPTAHDQFGNAVAVSADGSTIAVGAPLEQSETGAVYIFARANGGWIQQAHLMAAHPIPGPRFGWAVGLTTDGNALVVGAPNEQSCAIGVDGDETGVGCGESGAAYVFERTGGTWVQSHYLKPSNTSFTDGYQHAFGQGVAISGDGSTLAIGGPGDSSNATGIDGDQTNVAMSLSGAVYVFTRGATLTQTAYVKASNTDANDVFGGAVALSTTGDVMAIGATGEASGATGVNGSQADNFTREAGAAYVFRRTGSAWAQEAYVKASNSGQSDEFGSAIALSGTGNALVVGAYGESSNATGVDGNQADNSQLMAGALYAFDYAAGEWSQSAYLKGPTSNNDDQVGSTVAMSADGNAIATGAPFEDRNVTGVWPALPPTNDPPVGQSGAGYMFVRTTGSWATGEYIKAPMVHENDAVGSATAVSGDAHVIVVGARGDSNLAGAVYVIE